MRGRARVDIGDAVRARYETDGERFEILVKPELAWDFRDGKEIDIRDILVGYIIFEDALRGKKATDESIQNVFGNVDTIDIAKQILLEGEIQLTTEQRRKMVEEKRKQVVTYIAQNAINPQTGLPHPPPRIERALEEIKVSIDPWENVEAQVKTIVKDLEPIIPIRLEKITFAIKVPGKYQAKSYQIIIRIGTITKDEWQPDGNWIAILEMAAGLQPKLLDQLKKLTKGRLEVKKL
ncbi:MAG: ribosome assembly factor SBDS [Candidatus Helarchaeota archaeon]|nr:ribosome assembly factor SBDS [Candidatus Helarchaeota archaeon]NVM54753.1 ribosome assembly factor SBDS [Candidatus Helarchaeota archaeon]